VESISMRRHADVDVRPGGYARNRRAKGRKGDAVLSQKINQRLTFRFIGPQRNVHRITMIQMPLIVNCSLTEHGNG
jgi:hypothetical protein